MLRLWAQWRERVPRVGHCRTCDTECELAFCGEQCGRHYGLLSSVGTLSLGVKTLAELEAEGGQGGGQGGGMKRLLEIERDQTALDAMPDELVAAILIASYPRPDKAQFRALVAWRHVNARYRRVVDQLVFVRFGRLPAVFNDVINDAVLRLFPNLVHVAVNHARISGAALRQLRRLQTLEIYEGDWTGPVALTDGDIASLTSLTRLRLVTAAGGHSAASLTSLTRLSELELVHVTPHASQLQPLVKLTKLNLMGTFFDDALPTTLRALLDLQTNHLMDDASLLGVPQLTRLAILDAARATTNRRITNDGVSRLTALRALDLARALNVDGRALVNLRRLATLKVGPSDDGAHLAQLPALISLDLSASGGLVGDAQLGPLTRLEFLVLLDNDTLVTDEGLSTLTRLNTLQMPGQRRVTDGALRQLTALARLDIRGATQVTGSAFAALRRLRELNVGTISISVDMMITLHVDCVVNGEPLMRALSGYANYWKGLAEMRARDLTAAQAQATDMGRLYADEVDAHEATTARAAELVNARRVDAVYAGRQLEEASQALSHATMLYADLKKQRDLEWQAMADQNLQTEHRLSRALQETGHLRLQAAQLQQQFSQSVNETGQALQLNAELQRDMAQDQATIAQLRQRLRDAGLDPQ